MNDWCVDCGEYHYMGATCHREPSSALESARSEVRYEMGLEVKKLESKIDDLKEREDELTAALETILVAHDAAKKMNIIFSDGLDCAIKIARGLLGNEWRACDE